MVCNKSWFATGLIRAFWYGIAQQNIAAMCLLCCCVKLCGRNVLCGVRGVLCGVNVCVVSGTNAMC